MRIASVLGVVGLGAAIGTTAVLAPLAPPSSTFSVRSISDWSSGAISRMRSLAGETTSTNGLATSASAHAPFGAAAGQDAKTLQHIAHPEAPAAKTGADAKIVDTPWSTQVSVAPESAPARRLTSSKPASDDQRRDLVRDIQRELRRVGCFDAEADGQWNTVSRRAMGAFTQRVNATLPFEEPDFILLTLVQGHKGTACGKSCPAGQGLSEGQCVPTSILAKADRTKAVDGRARPDRLAAAAAPAPAAPQAPLASEATESKAAQAAIGSAWSITVLRPPIETGSARAVAAAPNLAPPSSALPAPTPPAVTVLRGEPLPGRMAIGGPLAPPLPAEQRPPAATVKPEARVAAAEPPAAAPVRPHTAPVTEPQSEKPERPEPQARANARDREAASSQAKRAPPVVVHRPPPPPRVFSPPSAGGPPTGSKSRRMVYDLYQRPDRN